MGTKAAHRRLTPFERHLLAQHLRDPQVRAEEIAHRRRLRSEAAGATEMPSPQARFYQVFLCASQS